jgi:beta-phosphoglucomutase-like phosphatase (HAD superfamily)
MKLKAIIFDVDGTLVYSNDIHARCWIEAFEYFGKRFEWEVIRHQLGKGGDLLVPDLLSAREMRKFGEKLKEFRSKLFKD